MQGLVEQLPPDEKEKYHEIVKENNKIIEGIESLQDQIKQKKERTEYLKNIISQSQVSTSKLNIILINLFLLDSRILNDLIIKRSNTF